MGKPISVLVAALAIVGTAAEAKQSCSVAASGHGYWSWRLIDGRKCWYEGKPMLSKSLLEWPAPRERAPKSGRELARVPEGRELARVPEEKAADPLDAQAYVPDDSATFDALWRDRIEKR